MKKATIKFVREYMSYGHKWFDIVYNSGRVCTVTAEDLPKTAETFIRTANHEMQYDRVFNRNEIIYN